MDRSVTIQKQLRRLIRLHQRWTWDADTAIWHPTASALRTFSKLQWPLTSQTRPFQSAQDLLTTSKSHLQSVQNRRHQQKTKSLWRWTLPFSRPVNLRTSLTTAALANPAENCGFCQDGGTCLCAQLAADQELQIQESTPAHLETDYTTLISSQSDILRPATVACTNDPGTCERCRTDATSTLLCTTLAASQPEPLRITSSTTRSNLPCPLGNACCRVSKTLDSLPTQPATGISALDLFASSPASGDQVQVLTGPTISCADAFTTLSRHPAFERASRDLGEWLPRLVTIPSMARGANKQPTPSGKLGDGVRKSPLKGVSDILGRDHMPTVAGRTAFDIEAASVMGVLRMFDRRFDRERYGGSSIEHD